MVGNNFVYTQLRRRRRSNTSPTSPTFTRRPLDKLDKPDGYLNVSSPADLASASTANSESPSLDIDVPSPTFEISSFSPVSPAKELPSFNNISKLARSSDEYGQNKRPVAADLARPATSSASAPVVPKPYSLSSPSSSTTSPPPLSSMRPSFEHLGSGTHPQDWRSRFYDQQGPTPRNFSTSSLGSDRTLVDDSGASRTLAPKKNRFLGLLQRRKSSQHGDGESGLTINTSGLFPLSTGPVSIRGTRIHDFNAPRAPLRIYSHNEASSAENSPRESRSSMQDRRRSSDQTRIPNSPGQRPSQSPIHSPMFKEHFNDDRPSLQPSQTAYLHSLAASQSVNTDSIPSNMPAFAKRLPVRLPENGRPSMASRRRTWRVENGINLDTAQKLPPDAPLEQPESPLPPPLPSKEPQSPGFDLPLISHLPQHMTSTSSRFSFQIGGQGSSVQEKLLEEKHKQQQASKKLADINGEDEADEDEFGDYDFDENELEERIPGVNADAEDDEDFEEPIPGVNVELDAEDDVEPSISSPNEDHITQTSMRYDGFHFTPHAAVFSPTQTHSGSQPTPRDDRGDRIGIADTKDSPALFRTLQSSPLLNYEVENNSLSGLGIKQDELGRMSEIQMHPESKNTISFDDEDLYFDDGDFDEIGGDDQGDFDENIFDDETGKIHDIPAENARRLQAAQQAYGPSSVTSNMNQLSLMERLEHDSAQSKSFNMAEAVSGLSADSASHRSCLNAEAGLPDSLTERNLEYHHALVAAANDAAASGRFSRNVSFSQYSGDQSSQSQVDESQQCLTSDESRLSHNLDPSRIAEDDGFPFDDDAFDDDGMIAEANAEVLENDDEGFYGEEFGFYARAKGKGSSDLTNGGYFGPRGANGVKRSHSAKATFPEPTLTPITERSEWSTRNSVASLRLVPGIPGSAHSQPSPGMGQPFDFDPGSYDDLNALAKLRGRAFAFGGSSTSINSMGGSLPGSSPLAYVSHHGLPSLETNHRMGSSIHSLTGSAGIPESEEEGDGHIDLPTLTQSTPKKNPSDPSPMTPLNNAVMSPTLGGWDNKSKISHSRTSSGAESVSYVKHPDGSGRWLLERRRTGDDGEPEVIGREYLAGARI